MLVEFEATDGTPSPLYVIEGVKLPPYTASVGILLMLIVGVHKVVKL
jgi:hypothetical protein